MKQRGSHRGCAVEVHNGRLRLRFRWKGRRYARQTDLVDTAENRREVERLAALIAATSDAGKDPRQLFKKEEEVLGPPTMTVEAYYKTWIETRTPPMVRRSLECDYKKHFRNHILPGLGPIPLRDLRARDILGLMAQLLKRGLSVKYVKNILGGSLKAMLRDARQIDELMDRDPFLGVRWPATIVPGPEPFGGSERNAIITWFKEKTYGVHAGLAKSGPRVRLHPPYYAFVHLLFWTGMRPSEAAGLQWGDVDLTHGVVSIVRSRHKYENNPTKTASSMRTVQLVPETIRILRGLQPLRIAPEMYVLTTTAGQPIEPNKTISPHWYRCLRALGIRQRGIYAMKDTYISLALSAEVSPVWLESQTGVRYETMRRHYGKWVRTEGADQVARLVQKREPVEPRLVSETM